MTKYLKASRHVSLTEEETKAIQRDYQDNVEELLEPAEMLRKLRVQTGLTPKELGAKIGVSGQQIQKLEEGELPIDELTAKKLGDLFQVDPKAFFF